MQRRAVLGFAQGFVGLVALVPGLFIVTGGVRLAGTGVWGYNDAGAGVYLAIGAVYALVGLALCFGGFLLIHTAARPQGPRTGPSAKRHWRREFLLALVFVLSLSTVALVVLCIALATATPSDTAEEGFASTVSQLTAVAAALTALAAGLLISRLRRTAPNPGSRS